MGTLLYGGIMTVRFDDRTLAHLQTVLGTKLRRRDSFFLSWTESIDNGSGRSTLWMHHSIPVVYRFDAPRRLPLNRAWLEILTVSANSPQGLTLTDEPDNPDSFSTAPPGRTPRR